MKKLLRVLLLSTAAVSLASAGTFSFTGTFATDDQVQLFTFTLLSNVTVTLQSIGYAGGTNAATSVIPPGGFDSYFTWFAGDGTQIGSNDDGGCGNVGTFHGACLDAYFHGFLSTGTYTLALTQSGNTPNGNLSDGFARQGAGNFTAAGACTAFCDSFGNQDNGNWAVDILNVSSAAAISPAPEPMTAPVAAFALSLLALARRRRARDIGPIS